MRKLPRLISATLTVVFLYAAPAGMANAAAPSTVPAPPGLNSSDAEALKAVSGFWYTENKEGGVELYQCGDHVCGRIAWISDPPDVPMPRDDRNPNPEQKGRPLCHMEFIGGFTPAPDRHYTGGWIYSPRHGADFSAHMTLIDHNTLKLRGYLLFPALGQSQIWTRDDKMPDCASVKRPE
jgi:uncharacterized protein (DUF2147 family)